MFSELIYTRCRQGIDILKGGRTISSDGLKCILAPTVLSTMTLRIYRFYSILRKESRHTPILLLWTMPTYLSPLIKGKR